MEQEKISKNVEFDVIYDDGERVRVREGILFDAKEDGRTMFHIGTSRANVFEAFFEATIEMMQDILHKKSIKSDKTTHEEKYKAVHICRPMKENQMQGIRLVTLEGMKGWYLVDEGVKVEGQGGACYATAIICCPFCGENLMN